MDRNQLLGALILSLAVVFYLNYFGPKKKLKEQQLNTKNDNSLISLTPIKIEPCNIIGTNVLRHVKINHCKVLENENFKLIFSSKGAQLKKVILKKYFKEKNSKKPITMLNEKSSEMGFEFTVDNKLFNSLDLYYDIEKVTDNSITFLADLGDNKFIRQTYTLKNNYQIELDIDTLSTDLKDNKLTFIWKNHLKPLEKDINRSKEKANINYYLTSNKFEALSIKNKEKSEKVLITPIKWVSVKQRFFTSGLVSDELFQNAHLFTIPTPKEDKQTVKIAYIKLDIPIKNQNKTHLKFYFGPNKLSSLKEVSKGFEENLYLGFPIIKQINKYIIYPIFLFLVKFIKNCGIIIFIIVILIKIVLIPLSYKSHISTAKMKVIKPELDEIKEKYGDDKQKIQMAQVALYKDLGVNPLSGCLPILLQMPVLFAMFNFFPNIIELRQEPFLWVKDLSTYDSIYNLPFSIPVYGDHISLFTLLMTISSVLSTFIGGQSNNNTDPSMKMFSFMMPIMFMAIFNSHPAALSYYYLISNLLTMLQQFIINKFVDEKELRLRLEENRKKGNSENVKPRAFARLEKMLDKKKKKK